MAADTFAALEQRVVRTIELLNKERELRASVERDLQQLRRDLEDQKQETAALRQQLGDLESERDVVRTRVERLMTTLDAIEAS